MLHNSRAVLDFRDFQSDKVYDIALTHEGECWRRTVIFADHIPAACHVRIRLTAPRARAELTILYLGKGKDATDMDIVMAHEAPDTFGRMTARAALYDESRFAFRGLLDIKEEGSGADSYLSAKALLLSDTARAEIYPYLEIKTNSVKASHGSSIGRIDPATLFYLQSRGLNKNDAERVVLRGFFGNEYATSF